MKNSGKPGFLLLIIIVVCWNGCNQQQEGQVQDSQNVKSETGPIEYWQDLKFGMFIHWGPVSLRGTEIGWSRGSQVALEEYDNLYKEFNPVLFDADQWVQVAKKAGMKYLIITTKHHDGFCLWDSKYTEYDIGSTPYSKDILKELSKACKNHGIRFGTYYSVCDWYHPDFPLGSPGGRTKKSDPNLERYIDYLRNQVTELITNYGPLLTMWFDVPQEVDSEYGIPTVEMVRELQPDILINNRAYRETGRISHFNRQDLVGDYSTPEQRVGEFNLERPWETCMTICRQWAWKPNDRLKSLKECLNILARTAGGGGNLLLNVGPMPDGRIEQRQIDRLAEMGDWLEKYGESIYGTRGGPLKPTNWMVSTRKENKIYLHLFDWPNGKLILPRIDPLTVNSARILGGEDLKIRTSEDDLEILLPESPIDENNTVILLTLDGKAGDIDPLDVPYNELKFLSEIGVCTQSSNLSMAEQSGASYVEESVRRFLVPTEPDSVFRHNLANVPGGNISIIACNSFLPGNLKSVGQIAAHKTILAYADTAFRRAKEAGIKIVVFGSGGSRKIPEGFNPDTARTQFISLLGELGPVAQKYDVVIVLEPLNSGETNFINSVGEGASIVREVNHPNIRLLADIYHMLMEGESPDAIRRAGSLIHHCHIAEKEQRTPPGVHGEDFTEYFKALKEIGYIGKISIECRWEKIENQLSTAIQTLKEQIAGLE